MTHTEENTVRAAKIAALNDELRWRLGERPSTPTKAQGMALMTHGVISLPRATQSLIEAAVRNDQDFTQENDPYGEHDFGSFEIDGAGKIFWKIDYYSDRSCTYGSEDPADPDRSFRVITIMLAQEY